jgi:hypothetical protein
MKYSKFSQTLSYEYCYVLTKQLCPKNNLQVNFPN